MHDSKLIFGLRESPHRAGSNPRDRIRLLELSIYYGIEVYLLYPQDSLFLLGLRDRRRSIDAQTQLPNLLLCQTLRQCLRPILLYYGS